MRLEFLKTSGSWLTIVLCALALHLTGRLIPPIQSPDEHSHILRAYALSQGHWQLITPPQESSGQNIPQALAEFIHPYLALTANPSTRLNPSEQLHINQLEWDPTSIFYPIPGTGYYLPLIYVPQALGWALGKALNWGIAQSYELARSINYLVCIAIISWALHLYRPPTLTLLILVLPMSLFQLYQPSIDGLSHALLLLLLCGFTKWRIENCSPSVMNICIWALGAFILIGARLHALPLILLITQLPKIKKRIKILVIGLILLCLTLWLMNAIKHTVDLRISASESSQIRIAFYLLHPDEALIKLFHTLTNSVQLLFYAQSWLGILGWLEVRLPSWYYSTMGLIIIYVGSRLTYSKSSINLDGAIFYGIVSGLSTILIFILLLVSWTPLSSPIIEGVQGRYFLIPSLIASFSWAHKKLPLSESYLILAGSFILNLYVMGQALLLRYH